MAKVDTILNSQKVLKLLCSAPEIDMLVEGDEA